MWNILKEETRMPRPNKTREEMLADFDKLNEPGSPTRILADAKRAGGPTPEFKKAAEPMINASRAAQKKSKPHLRRRPLGE